jgi:hypothetical protein
MKSVSLSIFVLIFSFSVFAQSEETFACRKEDRKAVREYFDNYRENDKILFEFYKAFIMPSDKSRFPFCWHGCAVSLQKPACPQFARESGLTGSVEIETIADETGKIIFAKATEENSVFRRNAENAACRSQFKPILFNEKPIKFRWKIVYNFVK